MQHKISVVYNPGFSNPKTVFKCDTMKEAVAFIAGIDSQNPIGVSNGYFTIDTPEAYLPPLTFDALRKANIARVGQFRNSLGNLAHTNPEGRDWSPAQWLQAVVGELGEYANFRKKFERGDITGGEFIAAASKELADVQTYLDILAFQLNIDLGEATRVKFNEVSKRVKCDVWL